MSYARGREQLPLSGGTRRAGCHCPRPRARREPARRRCPRALARTRAKLRFPGIRFRLGNRRTCSWSHDRDAASSQAPPRARWFRSSAFLKALERLAGEPRRDGAFEWEVFEDLSQEGAKSDRLLDSTSVLNGVPL